MEFAMITYVSLHPKEWAGVQTSTREAWIDDVTEDPSVVCLANVIPVDHRRDDLMKVIKWSEISTTTLIVRI
jgi:hypothetical protein